MTNEHAGLYNGLEGIAVARERDRGWITMVRKNGDFKPDYAIPPGETVLEMIESMGMSQAELAARMGRPTKTINEIIKGKAAITAETALQLERVLGVPASFWTNLEADYQADLSRLSQRSDVARRIAWLQTFPLDDMVSQGWIAMQGDSAEQVEEVFRFFGVASEETWGSLPTPEAAFKKARAFQSDPAALAAWLRKGELEANGVHCKEYHREAFTKCLDDVKELTLSPQEVFRPALQDRCAKSGVAVVFVPELPKSRVCGASWWVNPRKAIIELSLRYRTDDHFWFAFFHEAGHLLLHSKKEVFIDDKGLQGKQEESEANDFAARTLIPRPKWKVFVDRKGFTKRTIQAFAADLGIAPGIVVGQLQHYGLMRYNSSLNSLKRKLDLPQSA
ncbi:MAG: HigA family addiction module antitoxin [Bacillota bacterium]